MNEQTIIRICFPPFTNKQIGFSVIFFFFDSFLFFFFLFANSDYNCSMNPCRSHYKYAFQYSSWPFDVGGKPQTRLIHIYIQHTYTKGKHLLFFFFFSDFFSIYPIQSTLIWCPSPCCWNWCWHWDDRDEKIVWCGRPPPLDPRNQPTKTTRTGTTATGNGASNADLL